MCVYVCLQLYLNCLNQRQQIFAPEVLTGELQSILWKKKKNQNFYEVFKILEFCKFLVKFENLQFQGTSERQFINITVF